MRRHRAVSSASTSRSPPSPGCRREPTPEVRQAFWSARPQTVPFGDVHDPEMTRTLASRERHFSPGNALLPDTGAKRVKVVVRDSVRSRADDPVPAMSTRNSVDLGHLA